MGFILASCFVDWGWVGRCGSGAGGFGGDGEEMG